jgi:predicted transcriptional regulator
MIPDTNPDLTDSGPQRVLELKQAGYTQAEIAAELHIAQSTVSRRLKDARQAREIHYRVIARDLFLIVMAICAVILTAAVATIAWG